MEGNPLHTRLCEEYGCEIPVVAFAHTKDVIAAVSNAGGIGILGATGLKPEELRSDIAWIRDKIGDKPFGVDLLVPASFVEGNREDLDEMIPDEHREFVTHIKSVSGAPDSPPPSDIDPTYSGYENLLERSRQQLDVLFEEKVPIFASGLGSPAFIIERAHQEGMKVWGLVGLPRQARRQIEAGVDVVVAQGYDSGGHSGTVGTFTLVPEVVKMAEGTATVVLTAGGVSSGKHLAASIAMGSAGVWTGTIWLATHESETAMFLKQRIIDSKVEDAVQSRAMSGKPIRQLRSRWSDIWKEDGAPDTLPMPLQGMLVNDVLRDIKEANLEDWMTTPAGQAIVGIDAIKPAAEVVYDMADEALELFERATETSATA